MLEVRGSVRAFTLAMIVSSSILHCSNDRELFNVSLCCTSEPLSSSSQLPFLFIGTLLDACSGEIAGRPTKLVVEGKSYTGIPVVKLQRLQKWIKKSCGDADPEIVMQQLESELFFLPINKHQTCVVGGNSALFNRFPQSLEYFRSLLVADDFRMLQFILRKVSLNPRCVFFNVV